MGISTEKMSIVGEKLTSARLMNELPVRAGFSAALAVAGVCLYAFVPALQSSPYVYAIALFLLFNLAIWGFKSIPLFAWNPGSRRARILEVSGLAILMVVVLVYHQPLVAFIHLLFGQ
ncbi:MAG TPA: hypothetical protein VG206_21350 [Terriglobia bacterium]|nr:hypothetical protein [Terriglobia bacterium]